MADHNEAERLKKRMEQLAEEMDGRGLMGSKLLRRELEAHENAEAEIRLQGRAKEWRMENVKRVGPPSSRVGPKYRMKRKGE